MSLDLSLIENKCSHCGRSDEVWEGNYTYNVGDMWRAVFPDEAMVDIDGLTGREAEEKVTMVMDEMENEPKRFEAMNPENGWGSAEGFYGYLRDIRKACREYPDAIWQSWR